VKVKPSGTIRCPRIYGRVGLAQFDLGAGCGEPVGEVALQLLLLSCRLVVRVGRRVESDQSLKQVDEIALALRYRRAYAPLLPFKSQLELHLRG